MPRPPLPIGSWGSISRSQIEPKKWRARCRFRDFSGHTHQVEAWGPSGAAAQRKLEAMLRDRINSAGEEITGAMTLTSLGKMWLAELEQSKVTPQTRERYFYIFERVIKPGLGGVLVREATVSTVDRFLKATHERTPSLARAAKVVLSGMLGMAARHDAIRTNPVRDVAVARSPKLEVRALRVDDVQALRRAVAIWVGDPEQRGQRRSSDLPDVVDILLATGARIGELCALRWDDVDLGSSPPRLTISGTVVTLMGQGIHRQAHTKTSAGFRSVTLPRFAVETLLRRQVNASPNLQNLVFPSSTGTIRTPNNVRRQWRSAMAATGFEWVVPHTLRKTVATLIDQEMSTAAAASQLGHAKASMTAKHYIERAAMAEDTSQVLECFGENGG